MLHVTRTIREKYVIPDDAGIWIKLGNGKILTLPVAKGWSTSNGQLFASAELTMEHLQLFTRFPVTDIRIEPMIMNDEPKSYFDIALYGDRGFRLQRAVRQMYYIAFKEEPWKNRDEEIRVAPKNRK